MNPLQYNPGRLMSDAEGLSRALAMQRVQQGNALQRMQMEAFQQQQGEQQNALQRSATDEALMARLFGMPTEQQMPPGAMGPGAPMQNPGVDPRTFLAQGGSMGSLPKVQAFNQMMAPPVPPTPETPKQPSSVQEYQFAREQGYKGTFEQWRQANKPAGTTVNVNTGQKDPEWGSPPKDTVWARDASGKVITKQDRTTGAFTPIAVPIGGSAQDQASEKDAMRAAVLSGQADNVLETIAEAKKRTGYSTAGVGGLAAVLPMTDARALAGYVTTIKANLGFDRLQQMRDMSPTGGALGQVAVQELTSLQSTVAMLDQLQDPKDVMAALDKIERHYNRWKDTLKEQKQPRFNMPTAEDIAAEAARRAQLRGK